MMTAPHIVDSVGLLEQALAEGIPGSERLEHSGTRVVGIPVNEVHVYLVKECDHVA